MALVVKNPPANASNALDSDSILEPGRAPVGNGNPLQCSCLENPTDRGAWWSAVHGAKKSRIWLSEWTKIPPQKPCLISRVYPWRWFIPSPKRKLGNENASCVYLCNHDNPYNFFLLLRVTTFHAQGNCRAQGPLYFHGRISKSWQDETDF